MNIYNLEFEKNLEKGLYIANYLYDKINIPLYSRNKVVDVEYDSIECISHIIDNSIPIRCGGFQILMLYLMNENNVPCRPVVLFGEEKKIIKKDSYYFTRAEKYLKYCPNKPNNDQIVNGFSHGIVEIKDGGKWYLIDPTFNCSYKYKKNFLSSDELQVLFDEKKDIEYHYQYGVPKKQRIEYYFIPINDHNKIYYPGCKINKKGFINNMYKDLEKTYMKNSFYGKFK